MSRRKQSDSIKVLSCWSEGVRERSAYGRKRERLVVSLKVLIVGIDNNYGLCHTPQYNVPISYILSVLYICTYCY